MSSLQVLFLVHVLSTSGRLCSHPDTSGASFSTAIVSRGQRDPVALLARCSASTLPSGPTEQQTGGDAEWFLRDSCSCSYSWPCQRQRPQPRATTRGKQGWLLCSVGFLHCSKGASTSSHCPLESPSNQQCHCVQREQPASISPPSTRGVCISAATFIPADQWGWAPCCNPREPAWQPADLLKSNASFHAANFYACLQVQ